MAGCKYFYSNDFNTSRTNANPSVCVLTDRNLNVLQELLVSGL